MKIEKLRKDAVRSAEPEPLGSELASTDLKKVIGGAGSVALEIDPETCAIHFYYPADGVE